MAECKDTQADQVHGKVDTKTNIRETTKVCEQCRVDKLTLPAVGWCETCDVLLCNGCYEYHCRPIPMRNHQLVSIAEMKNMKQTKRLSIKCDKHEGKLLKYFCEDHTDLGCSQCFVTKHRPCGNVVCITDVNTNDTEEFKDLETLLLQFETRLKANEETILMNVGLAARLHDKAIADIKEAGDKLKAHIDDLVRQQIIKAQQRNEDNVRKMTCLENINKDIAKRVKDGEQMLIAEEKDNTRLFVTMKLLQIETGGIQSKLGESENENKVKEYEFKLSSELVDVLERVTNLGTLKHIQLHNPQKATDEVVKVVEVRRFLRFSKYPSDEGYVNDELRVSTDHDIRLLHILVFARIVKRTEVSLTINEAGNCLMKCYSSYMRDTSPQYAVAVNVVKEGGAHGITLLAGHQYDIVVKRNGGRSRSYYNGVDGLSKVTEKGVTVSFSNTDGTKSYSGIVAGLRFTIV